MATRILAVDGELILSTDTDVVNPVGDKYKFFTVFLPNIDGIVVATGWAVNISATGIGHTTVLDFRGKVVATIGPLGSKQFTAIVYDWLSMDLPLTFPANRLTGGSGGDVDGPYQISDITNLQTTLNGKANTPLPTATTAIFGVVEVDNNSSGAPIALTASGHGAAADPHPQYALDTAKGALNGIATLDGAGKLTASQLPLGTSSVTAAAGNDSRLSDNRAPLAHASTHQNGGSDVLNVGGLSGVLTAPQPPIIGATSTTAVAGNDARLTDARTPLSHVLATNVALGGTETISGAAAGQVLRASSATAANFQALVESDITNLVTDLAAKAATTDIRFPVYVRLTADNAAIAAAAPTTALQVALLTQAAAVNDEWDIEWIIEIANSVAADVFVFNVTSTAGTLTGRYTVTGTTGVPAAGAGTVKLLQNPVGTLTTATANAPGATGTIGLVLTIVVRARVKLTVSVGTIQLLLRAGTNGALTSGTATVKAQSMMKACRIA